MEQPNSINLAEWVWEATLTGLDEQQSAYTRPMKAKLDELKIAYRIVWEPGPGDEVRERVEAVKRWFVHDWQTLDNKVKSSIVEGVSVFLAMFDMPDVARVFCPGAPEFSDDPRAIEVQAQIRRNAAKAKEDRQEDDKKPDGASGSGTNRSRPYLLPKKKRLRARSTYRRSMN